MANPNLTSSKMNILNPQIVICGTDTDVGKTIVSCLLVQGLHAIYWKPIQSGLEGGGDTGRVCKLLNLNANRWIPELYKFKAPVSPHWAAEKENRCIDQTSIKIPSTNKPLIIEMAGGLMVPLNRQFLQIDLLQKWKLPIILVGRSGLGTLNHTLLSIEALKKREIPILGIILNGPKHKDNPKTIEQRTNLPIIAELPKLEEISAEKLSDVWTNQKLSIQLTTLIKNYY